MRWATTTSTTTFRTSLGATCQRPASTAGLPGREGFRFPSLTLIPRALNICTYPPQMGFHHVPKRSFRFGTSRQVRQMAPEFYENLPQCNSWRLARYDRDCGRLGGFHGLGVFGQTCMAVLAADVQVPSIFLRLPALVVPLFQDTPICYAFPSPRFTAITGVLRLGTLMFNHSGEALQPLSEATPHVCYGRKPLPSVESLGTGYLEPGH